MFYKMRQRWSMRRRARQALRRWGKDLDDVERYTMFLGYPRSGHSLVGALLTAHREMVVAHELDTLRWFDEGFNRDELLALCLWRDQWFARLGHEWTGYSYHVQGADQGRWDRLRVIGDKKGGRTAERLTDRPDLLVRLQAELGLPFRVIHVVRNPFDNIATMHVKGDRSLQIAADRYFELARANLLATERLGAHEVFVLYQEALVADPQATLAQLTRFLGVEADPDYLDRCADIVFESPRRSRFTVEWPGAVRSSIEERIEALPHLRGYGFDSTAPPRTHLTV